MPRKKKKSGDCKTHPRGKGVANEDVLLRVAEDVERITGYRFNRKAVLRALTVMVGPNNSLRAKLISMGVGAIHLTLAHVENIDRIRPGSKYSSRQKYMLMHDDVKPTFIRTQLDIACARVAFNDALKQSIEYVRKNARNFFQALMGLVLIDGGGVRSVADIVARLIPWCRGVRNLSDRVRETLATGCPKFVAEVIGKLEGGDEKEVRSGATYDDRTVGSRLSIRNATRATRVFLMGAFVTCAVVVTLLFHSSCSHGGSGGSIYAVKTLHFRACDLSSEWTGRARAFPLQAHDLLSEWIHNVRDVAVSFVSQLISNVENGRKGVALSATTFLVGAFAVVLLLPASQASLRRRFLHMRRRIFSRRVSVNRDAALVSIAKSFARVDRESQMLRRGGRQRRKRSQREVIEEDEADTTSADCRPGFVPQSTDCADRHVLLDPLLSSSSSSVVSPSSSHNTRESSPCGINAVVVSSSSPPSSSSSSIVSSRSSYDECNSSSCAINKTASSSFLMEKLPNVSSPTRHEDMATKSTSLSLPTSPLSASLSESSHSIRQSRSLFEAIRGKMGKRYDQTRSPCPSVFLYAGQVLTDSSAAQCVLEEGRHVEFKKASGSSATHQVQQCEKYCCAFLNSDGGTIYFGIEESDVDGSPVVRGNSFLASAHSRDLWKGMLMSRLRNMRPRVNAVAPRIDIRFVPVVAPSASEKVPFAKGGDLGILLSAATRYVVVVTVPKYSPPSPLQTRALFMTSARKAFVRNDHGIEALSPLEAAEWARNELRRCSSSSVRVALSPWNVVGACVVLGTIGLLRESQKKRVQQTLRFWIRTLMSFVARGLLVISRRLVQARRAVLARNRPRTLL